MLPLILAAWLGSAPALDHTRTLRVDVLHTGNATDERLALEDVALEGAWSGRPDRPLDDSGLGAYLYEVRDARDGAPLFSRGLASLFAEWRTTAEARAHSRTFHESLRFPAPRCAVDLVVKGRQARGDLVPLWSTHIDPRDVPAAGARLAGAARVYALQQSGAPEDKLDIVLLGDGYTRGESRKLEEDARRLTAVLFSLSPFRERRGEINVWVVETPSEESGISRPKDGVQRQSPLRTTFDAFGMERYVLTFDNERLRDIAAAAPYDALVILVNESHYGGGGIFGLYATCAAGSGYAPYVFVHELGHLLAGLADEYYLSAVSYEPPAERVEPWEPNVTADPRAKRWSELIDVDTPLPTPWPKEAYEALVASMRERREALRRAARPDAEIEALFAEEREGTRRLLAAAPQAGRVGAFEGAMYAARGYYRAAIDCIMFSRTTAGFCPVCRRALGRAIDRHSRGGQASSTSDH